LATQHEVVAPGIEFGAKYLYVCDAALPESAQGFADEHMLDDALSKR